MGRYIKKGRVYVETASSIDRVEFQGKIYRRYPDSPHAHLRRYFTRSRKFLHRAVWEFYNGVIPPEHHIHHKDENYLNNDISNLECLPAREHNNRKHAARSEYVRSEKQRKHLARIRSKASEWHRSEAGRQWHSENGKRAWEKRESHALFCEECGGQFSAFIARARFCSKSCQNRSWYKRHPDYGAQKRARAKARGL